MRVRKLDDNEDMIFGEGSFTHLKDSPETVRQIIQQRFNLNLGEWWLDVSQGIEPTVGVLNKTSIDIVVQDYILATEGVISIDSFESVYYTENREYVATVSVNTQYGTTQVEVTL